jgi:hypothetical protein
MKQFLRRLRGIIGTGLTWAVGWMGLIGLVVFPVLALFGAPIFSDFGLYLKNVFIVGQLGFIAGGSFGLVLTALERRKKLENLSFTRIALWGGIGGLVLVAISGPASGGSFLGPIIFFTLMGIGSATGTVLLAKRSDSKLIEGAEDPALSLGGEDEPLPALEGE